MKIRIASVSAAVLALGLAGSTFSAGAATPTPVIHRHRVHQQERIAQGMRSGRLTPRETMRLERGQRHVAWMVRRAKADGVVTPRERGQILRAQRMQSRMIFRQKHDRRAT
jgi:hypothetical protein